MRAYLILTLKWAITLLLAYCIYSTGHTYTAIALIWVMGWIEVLAYMIYNVLMITQETNTAIMEHGISQAEFSREMGNLFRDLSSEITKDE